jgi:hypothetical protein
MRLRDDRNVTDGPGTRPAEEIGQKPESMAEVADRPILWHIMIIIGNLRLDELAAAKECHVDFISVALEFVGA